MKRQVNFIVKLLVVLTVTLQVMPISVIAESLAESPTTEATVDQLTGNELQAYLERLTEGEQEELKGRLSPAQRESLALQDPQETMTPTTEKAIETIESGEVTQDNSAGEALAASSDSETVASSEEVEEEEVDIGAAVNFMAAGPLTLTEQPNTDNLVLNKSAAYNAATNTVDFQLEAYAKGQIISQMSPTDVTFVLDVSGSMADPANNDWFSESRLRALKDAVKSFADAMKESQSKLGTGQYHTMRIVTYAYTATTNPTIYQTQDNNSITAFKQAVEGLKADGGTRQDYGLAAARTIVAANQAQSTRKANQAVILFTDGKPDDNGITEGEIAGQAVNIANEIKNTYKATIYSVGIQNNADPSKTSSSDIPNSMLNGVSSNYLAAWVSNVSNYQKNLLLGTRNPEGNYYLTTNNASDLRRIFQEIATQIGKIDNLTIRDVLTEEPFVSSASVPIDLRSVKVYKGWTYSSSLPELPNFVATYGPNTRTIDVKNIALEPIIFNGNTPTPETKNNKLIIRFQVKVQDDFMGGNQVMTNEETSGAYTNSDGVENVIKLFDVPKVNIPLKDGGIRARDQKIYIGNSAQVGDFYTNLAKLNGKNNRYADVQYNISKNGTTLVDKQVPAGSVFQNDVINAIKTETEDGIYTVSYTVKPAVIATPSVASLTKSMEAKLYVFKPKLKVEDRKIYLTNELDLAANLPVITEWQHPQSSSLTALAFTGSEPTVTTAHAEVGDELTSESARGKIDQVTLSNDVKLAQALDFTIFIFRPELTSTNITIGLGESTNLSSRKSKTEWKNSLTPLTGIEGNAPDLSYGVQQVGQTTTEPLSVSPKEETSYVWKITANNQDISAYTTHVNTDYTANQPKPTGAHFTVYVKATSLVIQKTIKATGNRSFGDESFLFEVIWKKEGKEEKYYATITLTGEQTSGEVTLNRLKTGEYVVNELSNWSSRYESDGNSKRVLATIEKPGVINFTNTLKNSKWLSHESTVANHFTPTEKRADAQ